MNKSVSPPDQISKLPLLQQESEGGVSRIDDDTFLWDEVEDPNIEQMQAFAGKLAGLTEGLEHYYLLVDLTKAGRPNAEARKFLGDFFRQQKKLIHFSVVIGDDVILAIAARFVLSHTGAASSSFEKTREQALRKIKDSKQHGRKQTIHS